MGTAPARSDPKKKYRRETPSPVMHSIVTPGSGKKTHPARIFSPHRECHLHRAPVELRDGGLHLRALPAFFREQLFDDLLRGGDVLGVIGGLDQNAPHPP